MESIMKIYALDLETEFYKPENALKWLNIPYTTITDIDNIPNCPDDIIIASPKQFKDQKKNWDEEQLETAMKILSPKFKKAPTEAGDLDLYPALVTTLSCVLRTA